MRVVGADLHDNKRGSPRKDEANHLTHLVTHLLTHWLTQKATIHNILSILNAKIITAYGFYAAITEEGTRFWIRLPPPQTFQKSLVSRETLCRTIDLSSFRR